MRLLQMKSPSKRFFLTMQIEFLIKLFAFIQSKSYTTQKQRNNYYNHI